MARDKGEGMGKDIISIAVSSIGQVRDKVRGRKGPAETARYPALATIISRREGSFISITPPESDVWLKNEVA